MKLRFEIPGDPKAKGDPGTTTDYYPKHPGFGAVDLIGMNAALGTRDWHLSRDGSRDQENQGQSRCQQQQRRSARESRRVHLSS